MRNLRSPAEENASEELGRKVELLIGRLWRDRALLARMLEAPREVLAEAGLPLPDGVAVEVAQDTESLQHLVLPALDHPRRQVIEAAVEKVRAASPVEVRTLRDRKDLVHFVIPAPPPGVDPGSLDENEVAALAARRGITRNPDGE